MQPFYMLGNMDFKNAFIKSAALCAQQERCCFDIEKKLKQWEVDNDIIEKVLEKLIEENFIDDNRFAGFYARDKFRFNRWGKTKIAWHLRQKQIAPVTIKAVLDMLNEGEYGNTLFLLLSEKARSLSGREPIKKKAALVRFAASRGFEYDEIMKTLDRLL